MKLIVNNTHDRHPDYHVGVRFVPHVPVPTPMFTGDELLFACWLSAIAGVVITVGLAFVWSFFL